MVDTVSASFLAQVDQQMELALQDPYRLGGSATWPVPRMEEIVGVARRMASGGKRFRARFVYAGWRAADAGIGPQAVAAAGASVELFQLAALIHDDVIDQSDERRGMPAAHVQLRELNSHQLSSRRREHLGRSGAILLGDLAVVLAAATFEDALETLTPAESGPIRRHFHHMMAEVTLGQYLDMALEFEPMGIDLADEIALSARVLQLKSARYSVEHPLTLGAELGGATQALVDELSPIGLALGEAFQLRDDVIGIFADPKVSGKPAGGDIEEGKRTLLLLSALERASAPQRQFIKSVLGHPGITAVQVLKVREIISETGALSHIEQRISDSLERALEGIARLQAPGDLAPLQALTELVTNRTS